MLIDFDPRIKYVKPLLQPLPAWLQTGQIPAKQGLLVSRGLQGFPAARPLLDLQEATQKKLVSIDGRDCLLPSVGTLCVNS